LNVAIFARTPYSFFAYWHDRQKTEVEVAKALHGLRQMQREARPGFRVVVHYGEVAIGGLSLGDVEQTSGEQVHFTFRMEKLAGKLREPNLLSEAACERLSVLLRKRDVGRHSLEGFDSKFQMFSFD
jgi:class 3 adenylate cyclase